MQIELKGIRPQWSPFGNWRNKCNFFRILISSLDHGERFVRLLHYDFIAEKMRNLRQFYNLQLVWNKNFIVKKSNMIWERICNNKMFFILIRISVVAIELWAWCEVMSDKCLTMDNCIPIFDSSVALILLKFVGYSAPTFELYRIQFLERTFLCFFRTCSLDLSSTTQRNTIRHCVMNDHTVVSTNSRIWSIRVFYPSTLFTYHAAACFSLDLDVREYVWVFIAAKATSSSPGAIKIAENERRLRTGFFCI